MFDSTSNREPPSSHAKGSVRTPNKLGLCACVGADIFRATNMKIYSMIMDMQNIQCRLPPQVDRQQPVYFEDAHGRVAPFHVEFINSFEVNTYETIVCSALGIC